MAVEWTSETGEVHDFALNAEKLVAMEDAGEGIFLKMNRIATSIRFKDLFEVADALDVDYKEFCSWGYNVGQLGEIVMKCLEELGFTSEFMAANMSA